MRQIQSELHEVLQGVQLHEIEALIENNGGCEITEAQFWRDNNSIKGAPSGRQFLMKDLFVNDQFTASGSSPWPSSPLSRNLIGNINIDTLNDVTNKSNRSMMRDDIQNCLAGIRSIERYIEKYYQLNYNCGDDVDGELKAELKRALFNLKDQLASIPVDDD